MTPAWRIDAEHWDGGRVWAETASYEGWAYVCGGCGFRHPDHNELTRHIGRAIRASMAEWLARQQGRPLPYRRP